MFVRRCDSTHNPTPYLLMKIKHLKPGYRPQWLKKEDNHVTLVCPQEFMVLLEINQIPSEDQALFDALATSPKFCEEVARASAGCGDPANHTLCITLREWENVVLEGYTQHWVTWASVLMLHSSSVLGS